MLFNEEQYFRQKIILIPIVFSGLIILTILSIGLYSQMLLNKHFGNNPMSNESLIILIILLLLGYILIFWLINHICLFTRINSDGISVRFRPFHSKYVNFYWHDIESYEIIKYNPIGDFGGWGISSGKKGKAYNVSGNIGLLIVLKSKKKILIGTQKKEEMEKFLIDIKNENQY